MSMEVAAEGAACTTALAILDAHVSHGGAGAGTWNADCLAVACDWTDHGSGGLVDAIRAHQRHLATTLAAEIERAVLETAARNMPWRLDWKRGDVQGWLLDRANLATHGPRMSADEAKTRARAAVREAVVAARGEES